MRHEIDLKKYKIHTNLLLEDIQNIPNTKKIKSNISLISINIDNDKSHKYHKKIGNYKIIEFRDITDFQNRKDLIKIVQEELLDIYRLNDIKETDSCLIIGLGNINSTPDSLGPNVIKKVIVTSPLYIYSKTLGFRKTYAFIPGVMEESGIDTSDILKSIIKKVKPDFLIIVDSLLTKSLERLNKTIQITDTGINPGSGIKSKKKEISKKTMNIPVISIGTPTIIETKDYFMITSYEIDLIIKRLSDVISEAINNSLHKTLR